ncbi:MAG TPA: DMT family transporter, partial [Beijerinckiaceae bacterium]|nr:DMT family transporter [Beijerinckiaceae bacterium]
SWLWIVFTVAASGAQTARNAMQRDLIATLGTAGATFVRFLFGLPFALLFLALVSAASGVAPPTPGPTSLLWTGFGGVSQILATGLMLAAMREKSFVVAIAYTKTEPVQVALFGLLFLGDRVTGGMAAAIAVATLGVMLMSWPKRSAEAAPTSWRAAVFGLVSAAMFAFSAIGYRAGILALGAPNFVLGASTILALALAIQSGLIVIGLALFDRALLARIFRAWRPSLLAGFMGALASQFWFLAFAIDTAARVRTLALIEMIFAQVVTKKIFQQKTSAREIAGMAIMIAGVVILMWT